MNKNRMTKAIAHRLRRARIEAGFATREAAARALKVRSNVYWRHEEGTQGIGVDFLARYAKEFMVSPGWLAFGEDR